MNKNAIQKFAIWARNELIAQVSQRAYQYGIDESGFGDASADTLNGRLLTAEEKSQRQELIGRIKEKGYKQVMEEVAYTWFNRFIALRFMEVNNYLPSHIRVFSDSTGAFKPEILSDVLHLELPGLSREKVAEYIESNDTEGLYRYLLLTQCNALNDPLPRMFEKMGGYTELLLPNNILRQDSVLGHMVSDIPEEDWQDAVQIIGWLYQYYNTELKDDTFALLKKNVKITKERIPSATQLFTPDWIVRYMVENSLGRIYVDKRKNEGIYADGRGLDEMTWHEAESERIATERLIADKMGWKYYLPEAEQTQEVRKQLDKIQAEYANLDVKDIRVIDPCMGSGHILVYAFDVLMQIYEASGYSQRDAAQSILENNLFGLDIDDRAAQLAYFAVMMKARQYDRRLLTRGIQPNIFSIRESNGIQAMTIEYFHKNDPKLKADIERIVTEMRDAKEYGSILNITPVDFAGLYARFDEIRNDINMMQMSIMPMSALDELLPLVNCAELLAQKYDVVMTNPPYMGGAGMNARLAEYVKSTYPNTKSDMSTVFMEKTVKMCNNTGYMSMINIPVWMFLASYEKLREILITQNTFTNMVHFGRGVFGSDFGTTAFVIARAHINGYKGTYCRLFEKQGAVDSVETKEKWFLEGMGRFVANQSNFSIIPGSPVAYWVSKRFIENFNHPHISDSHYSGGRNKTHNNEKYTRLWWEIADREKWQLYVKGGDFRRWYGNQETVVDWSNSAKAEYDSHGGLYNQEYSGKTGICWTLITSAKTAFRVKVPDAHYDSGAPTIFNDDFSVDNTVLGFLNSNVATEYLSLMNPTINMGNTYVLSLPNIDAGKFKFRIDELVSQNIITSRDDWDSYENSCDFKRNPLV